MTAVISERRRREVVDALRRGTVPQQGLDVLAVGLDRFVAAVDADLDAVASGGSAFKAVRGEYGSGKTFFARWMQERAKQRGLATAEVQISETETPLHRLETVYRRVTEALTTAEFPASAPASGAGRVDVHPGGGRPRQRRHRRVRHGGAGCSSDTAARGATGRGEPQRADIRVGAARFRTASSAGDSHVADGLVAWLGGQPNVSSSVRRAAGVKGELDHFGAFGFLQGLLTVLRDSGHPGLLLVLDEVETLQRVRTDVRDKALNALRQLMDETDSGRFPGLYLVMTGTPAFFDGTQGIQRLSPLAQRLAVDFTVDSRFDNPRAAQVRLAGFGLDGLGEIGRRVRDLYAGGSVVPDRIRGVVDDAYVDTLARAVTGQLGGKVGIAPRVFLKKLVGEVLDRVDQHADFDPMVHYQLTMVSGELSAVERNALVGAAATSVDDIVL